MSKLQKCSEMFKWGNNVSCVGGVGDRTSLLFKEYYAEHNYS